MSYIELQITSNFSFLRGGSHPEELVEQAFELGYDAIAITDHNTLAGIVRAHAAAKLKGIRLIVGCRLNLIDGPSLLAYPTCKDAYARLSGLLSWVIFGPRKENVIFIRRMFFPMQKGCFSSLFHRTVSMNILILTHLLKKIYEAIRRALGIQLISWR